MDCGPTALRIVARVAAAFGRHLYLHSQQVPVAIDSRSIPAISNGPDARHVTLMMISVAMQRGWGAADRMIGAWYADRELPDNLPIDPRAEEVLSAHEAYCRQAGITGTPTFLIDQRRLPGIYDLPELKILH